MASREISGQIGLRRSHGLLVESCTLFRLPDVAMTAAATISNGGDEVRQRSGESVAVE